MGYILDTKLWGKLVPSCCTFPEVFSFPVLPFRPNFSQFLLVCLVVLTGFIRRRWLYHFSRLSSVSTSASVTFKFLLFFSGDIPTQSSRNFPQIPQLTCLDLNSVYLLPSVQAPRCADKNRKNYHCILRHFPMDFSSTYGNAKSSEAPYLSLMSPLVNTS